MYLYFNLIILFACSALISSIIGLFIYQLSRKLPLPNLLGAVLGGMGTLLIIRLILSFLGFDFYDAAIAGLAIGIYVLFLLHLNGIFNIIWSAFALIALLLVGFVYVFTVFSENGMDEMSLPIKNSLVSKIEYIPRDV